MEINKIGVLGAGTMGSGIAQVAAEAGFAVIMRDLEDSFVHRGMTGIYKNLGRSADKGKISKEEVEKVVGRISGTTSLEDLSEVDLVIEAVVEDMNVKRDLYGELDRICPQHAILASNTSGLSISEMAAATGKPGKVIGMHFFNPAPVMKLVEVTKGALTSDETFQLIMDLSRRLGKDPIAVNEAPLFVVNRILIPMINEAAFVLMEGVASAEDIDKGMMLGANHPMGPLALADLVGIDVLLLIQDTLYEETGDSKYRACPLIRKMVRAGHLGRKSGRGFYQYD